VTGPARPGTGAATRRGRARNGPLDARLVHQLPVLRGGLVGFGAATTLATFAIVAQAALIAHVVAAVFIDHAATGKVDIDLVCLAVAMALKALSGGATEWIGQHVSARARLQLRQTLLAAVARLGTGWLADTPRGQVVTTAGSGIESLDGYLTRAVPAIVAAVITPPVVLVAIGVTDWQSMLILAATVPLVPAFLALIGITTKRHMDRQWATLTKLSGQFLDLLQGLATLKVYGRSQAQVAAVRDSTDRYRRHTLASLKVAFLSGLVVDLIATLSVALVAVAVGLRLDHGHLSLARALTVLLLAPEVYAPIRAVGAQHHAAAEARAVVESTLQILDEAEHQPPDGGAGAGAVLLRPSPDGSVAHLRQVEFTYPDRDVPAVHGIDLDLYAGQLVALVGPSGAGKTSLLSLLLGQVSPTQGDITVGASNAPLRVGAAWCPNVAWVPQRPRLTQDTVADEIRLGDPSLTDSQLARILQSCAAPRGETAVGEDGAAISAGQRRRVALARAVARANRVLAAGGIPLVLLDEPTEDLDADTEDIVAQVLTDLSTEAAVVAATHDPILRSSADRVIQVVDGCIAGDTINHVSRPEDERRSARPHGLGRQTPDDVQVLGPATVLTPLDSPFDETAGPPPDRRSLRLGAAILRAAGARRSLLLAGLFGALGGISGLALTATSVWLICRAAQHPNVQALALAVVGVRTFALARALLRYGERLAAHDGALRLLADVRSRVFAALEPLAPAGLTQFRRGDLLRRFTSDVDGAQEALVRAGVPLAGAVATAGAATLLVAFIDPTAACLLAIGLLIAGAVIPILATKAGQVGPAAALAAGRRDALVNGLLDGLSELAAYGAVSRRLQQIGAADAEAHRLAAPANRAGAASVTAAGITAAVTVTAVLFAGARAVVGSPSAGIWFGVLAAASLVAFETVSTLPAAYAALGRCLAGLDRVNAVLDTPIPVALPLRAVPAPLTVTGLTAAAMTLRPAAGADPVLVDTALELAQGRRIALIGPSGSGKSTLLAAMLRLLPTEVNPISLGRSSGPPVPVCDLHPDQLPPLVAGSLQGDHVFGTTLRDNLRMVSPEATDDDLDALAARVGLAKWIRSLPGGWSTPAGADGAQLSGGQRQRLLVARALLANPQILVLDEPTAHLDAATAAAVMADLIKATKDRSLIMSTHRAQLLLSFDDVLRIHHQQIVACPPSSTDHSDPVQAPAVAT
jgi:ATP-binding cassette subfamily C protein CydCD